MKYVEQIGLGIDFTARDKQSALKAKRPALGTGQSFLTDRQCWEHW